MTAHLPDAVPANWVDRRAPEPLRPWLRLGRFDRPAGTWMLLLPGWQAIALCAGIAGTAPDVKLLILFGIGALVMRAAGCAFNDIVDRDLDAKVARTAMRPIPAGQISVKGAVAFVVGCSLIGLVILLTMNPLAIGLGVASLALVAAYPFMKRITWWPQAWLGLTFNWGAVLGYAAVKGEFGLPALLLYASGFFWTLGYDTIYALQDLEDDALAGVKSTARRLGKAAPKAIAGFYVACAALALLAGVSTNPGPLFYPLWLTFALHLGWQTRRVDIKDGAGALKLFRANRDAGLLLFAGFALGAVRF